MKYTKKHLQDLSNDCIDVEFYQFNSSNHSIHTDNITSIDIDWADLPDEDIECKYALMDEREYERTILANSSASADFADWYDDSNAIVMIIVLNQEK